MKWDISIIKEGSYDPNFNVKISCKEIGIIGAVVEVVRVPPKVTFSYPDEVLEHSSEFDGKKLELEILNKIVEYMISQSGSSIYSNHMVFNKNKKD